MRNIRISVFVVAGVPGAVTVRLSLQRQRGRVRLCVRANGNGFDTAAQADGLGLCSMLDRANSAVPGLGTEVEVRL